MMLSVIVIEQWNWDRRKGCKFAWVNLGYTFRWEEATWAYLDFDLALFSGFVTYRTITPSLNEVPGACTTR